MKKLGFPAIMLLLAGVIGVGVWSYFYSPFPVRIRRLVQASYQHKGAASLKANRALRRMGIRATPALIKLMRHNNSEVRRAAIQALEQIQLYEARVLKALKRALSDKDWRVRRAASQMLGKRRWRSAPATDALAAALAIEKEWLVRKEMVVALGQIGPFARAAIPVLLRSLKDKEWSVRRDALIALSRVGLPTPQALNAYHPLLQDRQWRVRAQAARQLGAFKTQGLPVFHHLVQAAHDSNARVQAAAVKALQQIGAPALTSALAATSPWQRVSAARALGMLGSRGATAVKALTRAAGDPHPSVRKAALETLSRVGPKGMTAFLDLLQHQNPKMRAMAARQLSTLSTFAVVTTPALHRMLQDANREVRWAAAQAIARLPPTLPTLRTLLSHNKPWVRRTAVTTLARLGPQSVLILLEALSNSDHTVRSKAATALGQMQTHQGLILRDLAVALGDKADSVKIAAANTLLKHDDKGKAVFLKHLRQANEREYLLFLESVSPFDAVGSKTKDELLLRLRRSLGSQQAEHKATAARILASLGSAAASATPLLGKLLDDKAANVRLEAIRALGKIGVAKPSAPDKAAIEKLQQSANKRSGQERLAAFQSLVELGKQTPVAVGSLRKLLRDHDATLRKLSAQALKQLGAKAEPALPDLMWALDDAQVRSVSAAAIGAIGKAAVPSLLPLLRHQKQWVRWTVIEVLATYGEDAKAAAPALRKALHDPITAVRIAAARALSQIEPQEDAPTGKQAPSKAPAKRPKATKTPKAPKAPAKPAPRRPAAPKAPQKAPTKRAEAPKPPVAPPTQPAKRPTPRR